MKQINFMTIGDKNFFHIVDYSVKQIRKFYPKSTFFIYDWGFTPEQLKTFGKYKNIKIIDWKSRIDRKSGFKNIRFGKNWRYYVKKYILKYPQNQVEAFRQMEYIFSQKPLPMLDCAKRIKENLIFLDGDVFLVNKIDEIINDDFDIGVTLRPKKEVEASKLKGDFHVLNAGVIFFNSNSETIQLFIKKWIEVVKKTRECNIEQTALTRLIGKTRKDIYSGYFKTGILNIEGHKIKCKIFPCKTYNYNWIESGFDKEKNKILHFKGKRHAKEKFKELFNKNKAIL